jgi:hypothetical protein
MAEDHEADVESGRALAPKHYEPTDPAFWWAMAQECRRIVAEEVPEGTPDPDAGRSGK